MAVHPSSVIPTWVNDFKSSFYDSLTSQENTAFLADFTFWEPEFQKIATALDNWKAGTSDARTGMDDFIIRFMTYITVGLQFPSILTLDTTLVDAYTVYSINDFMVDTESRPDSYYDDKTDSDPPNEVWYSPKIDAAVAQINGWKTPEETAFDAILTASTSAGVSVVKASLFESPPVVAKTKQDFAVEIFTTRNWKAADTTLTLGLPVPDYV